MALLFPWRLELQPRRGNRMSQWRGCFIRRRGEKLRSGPGRKGAEKVKPDRFMLPARLLWEGLSSFLVNKQRSAFAGVLQSMD